uniref:Repressor of RNA polymerase III transcription MAF1 homolog n=1 Tax=Panagrolaimus superbus TaxID=310955 RepID=A0A914Y7U9_9BILA
MKLLDNATLNEVSSIVSSHANDCSMDMKLESYSIKMVSTDKKSWKKNMSNPASEIQTISVPEDTFSSSLTLSPLGTYTRRFRHYSERSLSGSDNDTDENHAQNLAGTVSRKMLFNLNQALNTAFPDYDFSYRSASSFLYYPNFEQVKEVVDKHLSATVDSYNQLQYNLWGAIEEEILLFSYITSNESDPFNEDGVMWSLNFLFFNKTLRRILLFSVRAIHQNSSEEEGEDIEYVMDYQD